MNVQLDYEKLIHLRLKNANKSAFFCFRVTLQNYLAKPNKNFTNQ